VSLQVAQVVIYNLTFTQAQGRFLFPALGSIVLLMTTGLLELARRAGLPEPGPRAAALGIALMAIANMAVLELLVAPAYGAAIRAD
ncbi:MAG TPA: hypothetical protein VJV23_11455, partial [Candidatus Polarisedimenticolia bacterium]|nr:hypothetical protein [Candidatus Polarisedimenticolia bacterium]